MDSSRFSVRLGLSQAETIILWRMNCLLKLLLLELDIKLRIELMINTTLTHPSKSRKAGLFCKQANLICDEAALSLDPQAKALSLVLFIF